MVDGFSKYGFGAALDKHITPACRGFFGRLRTTRCRRAPIRSRAYLR